MRLIRPPLRGILSPFSRPSPIVRAGAGAPAATIDDVALAYWDAGDLSTLWQDSGKTAAVTAGGQTVGAWDDAGGAGYTLLQTSAVQRPVYQTSGGRHWVYSDGFDDELVMTDRMGLGANPDVTVVFAGQWVTVSGGAMDGVFQIGGVPVGSTLNTLGMGQQSGRHTWRYAGGYQDFGVPTAATNYTSTWRRASGTTFAGGRYFRDGVEESVSASSVSGSPTDTGAYTRMCCTRAGTGFNYGELRIYRLAVLNRNSDADQAVAEAWAAAAF